MIEAVGYNYMNTYFNTSERLIKKDGLMLIQAIILPDKE